jgi:hypothetical protein
MLNLPPDTRSCQLFDAKPDSWTSSTFPSLRRPLHRWGIDRLALELRANEGLAARFHAGVAWRSEARLLPKGVPVAVAVEQRLRAGWNRYVPDLTIWCPRTQRILLLIEVWDFHPVSRWKAQAYGAAGLPWIEVRASHVLARHRKSPLPVLDWGGPGLPESPHQARVVN